VYEAWDARTKGEGLEKLWNNKFAEYKKAFPKEAAEFLRRTKGDLPANWAEHAAKAIAAVNEKAETIATRKASQNAINALQPALPEFLGGSADLTGSNLTNWTGAHHVSGKKPGNYISYGVREFGMSHIMNGMALHGGLLPFGGTFLMFSEYARNALRMSALMKQRVIYVFTHDSIGLGEDGPTHQPVEQTTTLRFIPNMDTWRPCDTVESMVSWVASVERKDGPSSLIFSRQNLTFQKRDAKQIENIRKGAYILSEAEGGKPQAVIISTGSEVDLAMKAQAALAAEGVKVRVVSMPSTNVFDRQEQAYKDSVLPKGIKRVSVEAGVTGLWYKYVGLDGAVIGMDCFGESAPAPELFKHFGFTVENVVATVKKVIG
jgi:transketolase